MRLMALFSVALMTVALVGCGKVESVNVENMSGETVDVMVYGLNSPTIPDDLAGAETIRISNLADRASQEVKLKSPYVHIEATGVSGKHYATEMALATPVEVHIEENGHIEMHWE